MEGMCVCVVFECMYVVCYCKCVTHSFFVGEVERDECLCVRATMSVS